MSSPAKLHDKLMKRAAVYSEGPLFTIIAPNYTAFDQGGTTVDPFMHSIRYHPVKGEPQIAGGKFFNVYGDRRWLQPGYVLVPSAGELTIGVNIMTVYKSTPLKIPEAVMTDHQCAIYENLSTPLYINLRFQWLGPALIGPGLNEFEDTVSIGKRKLLVYYRQGIGLNPPIQKGHFLVETNSDQINSMGYVWTITDIVTYHKLTVITVKENA